MAERYCGPARRARPAQIDPGSPAEGVGPPRSGRRASRYRAGMDLGLAGRRLHVTGASQGIGREVVLRLAAEGAAVGLVARRRAVLEAVAREATDAGAAAVAVAPADLSLPGEAERAVAGVVDDLGGLDGLVNNVGVARNASVGEFVDEDWERSFQVNLMSYVRTTAAALPHLRASGQARIVNVASTAGKRPSASMPDYSVMKAAVLSYSRLIADAEVGNGVLVNAIAPGPTATPAWLGEGGLADQAAARSGGSREEALRKTGAGRPIGRLAEPDEIADVIVFLCSARVSYVSGAAWASTKARSRSSSDGPAPGPRSEIADLIVFLCSARVSYVSGAAWGVDGGTVPVII